VVDKQQRRGWHEKFEASEVTSAGHIPAKERVGVLRRMKLGLRQVTHMRSDHGVWLCESTPKIFWPWKVGGVCTAKGKPKVKQFLVKGRQKPKRMRLILTKIQSGFDREVRKCDENKKPSGYRWYRRCPALFALVVYMTGGPAMGNDVESVRTSSKFQEGRFSRIKGLDDGEIVMDRGGVENLRMGTKKIY